MASGLMKTLKIRSLKLATATVAARNLSSFINQIGKHTAESVQGFYADKWKPEQRVDCRIESDGDMDSSAAEKERCREDEEFSGRKVKRCEDEFSERRKNVRKVFNRLICDKMGGIASGNVDCPRAIESAQFAISFLGNNVEFVKLVRVNWEPVSGVFYYLTIEASDKNFYEAKVWVKPGPKPKERVMYFIRPARSRSSGQS